MKKKRTLNQTWVLCLRMWQWIAKVWVEGMDVVDISVLKVQWLRDNKLTMTSASDCFFCDYCCVCSYCPGALVDDSFRCGNEDYNFKTKPVEFYKELLRLNRIRKAKK